MYALASKGFGKKAVDLNKKDFYDGKTGGQKFTAKGKTSTGVEWEANTHQGEKETKTVKVTIPVDSKCKLACEIKDKAATELTASIDLGSGMDLELKVPNPDLTALAGTDMNATFNYKTADFSVESAFKVYNGGFDLVKGGFGGCAAVAFDCPGLDGFKLALKPSITLGETKTIVGDVMFGYDAKDYSFAVVGAHASFNGKAANNYSLRGFFKATSSTNVAFEVDNVGFKAAKAGYGAVQEDPKGGFAMKIGADYKINSSTTAKVKFSGSTPEFAVKCALDNGNVVFANSGANFGMVYTLEA